MAGAIGEPARVGDLVNRVQVFRARRDDGVASLDHVVGEVDEQAHLERFHARGVLGIAVDPQRVVVEESRRLRGAHGGQRAGERERHAKSGEKASEGSSHDVVQCLNS